MRPLKALVTSGACMSVLASPSDYLETRALQLASRQTPTGNCSTGVHIIAASGGGSKNIGGYGLIGSLVTMVVAAIPGSDNVTLSYEKNETMDPFAINSVISGGVSGQMAPACETPSHSYSSLAATGQEHVSISAELHQRLPHDQDCAHGLLLGRHDCHEHSVRCECWLDL